MTKTFVKKPLILALALASRVIQAQTLETDEVKVTATRVEKVVDTTAAGDSFSAGYLAKRLQGGTIVESAQAGHLLAGTVIQHKGAIIPKIAMPSI